MCVLPRARPRQVPHHLRTVLFDVSPAQVRLRLCQPETAWKAEQRFPPSVWTRAFSLSQASQSPSRIHTHVTRCLLFNLSLLIPNQRNKLLFPTFYLSPTYIDVAHTSYQQPIHRCQLRPQDLFTNTKHAQKPSSLARLDGLAGSRSNCFFFSLLSDTQLKKKLLVFAHAHSPIYSRMHTVDECAFAPNRPACIYNTWI